jgi:hypothetical protein
VCLAVIGIGLGVLTVFTLGLMPWRSRREASATREQASAT